MRLFWWLKDWFRGMSLGGLRSNRWPKVRNEFIKEHPRCAVCNGTKKCEIHHKKSFHLHPELELEKSNLLTLCESKKYGVTCHQFFGHLGDYRKENPTVESDCFYWNKKLNL